MGSCALLMRFENVNLPGCGQWLRGWDQTNCLSSADPSASRIARVPPSISEFTLLVKQTSDNRQRVTATGRAKPGLAQPLTATRLPAATNQARSIFGSHYLPEQDGISTKPRSERHLRSCRHWRAQWNAHSRLIQTKCSQPFYLNFMQSGVSWS